MIHIAAEGAQSIGAGSGGIIVIIAIILILCGTGGNKR